MKQHLTILLLISLSLIAAPSGAALAQSAITATNDRTTLAFPESITFSVDLQSSAEITSVVLEYGVDQLTCGTVIAKAFPDFTPGASLSAEWTWDMRQSGSLPPGATLWWQWRVADSAGDQLLTERQSVSWLGQEHDWQSVSGDFINLHWYRGSNSFARTLHDSAVKSLRSLKQTTGLEPDNPIDLYIFGTNQDMRDTILYEPGWTGGQAFPDYDIVIIAIEPDQMAWGKRAQAHELTHVLVGHLTFSCLSFIPTWLNEGLAVYGEGGLEESWQRQLQQAIAADTLIPVRALSGGFSEDPAQADLSYSQSYSLVNFLIEKHGQEKMLSLLRVLRDGAGVDEALLETYGFDIEGLEDAWRAAIGAQPRTANAAGPTPTVVPTLVPTFVPVSVVPAAATPAPATDQPTAAPPIAQPTPVTSSGTTLLPGTNLIIALGAGIACVFAVGLIAVGIALSRGERKG